MSDPSADPGDRFKLRQEAQHKLTTGGAPTSRGWGVSVEALALLHRLASTPASAADAMKLLHELQVHQVELDLQQAQLEANEHDTAEELARYRTLYECAPVALFVLDAHGQVRDCNRAGAQLLGAGSLEGRGFGDFLSPASRPLLSGLLHAAQDGASNPACTVRAVPAAASTLPWRLSANALPTGDAILLAVCEVPGTGDG